MACCSSRTIAGSALVRQQTTSSRRVGCSHRLRVHYNGNVGDASSGMARSGVMTFATRVDTFPPYLPELGDDYHSTMGFSEYANWLIPGVLMAGRYPFVEPSRCTKRADGEAMLEQLVMSGIKTFISLQGELPPQEEMPLKGVDGFQAYKAPATLIAAALSDPPTVEEMNGLRTHYLDKFLPPKREKKNASPSRRIIELEFLHYPITDLSIPTMSQLDGLVETIIERAKDQDVMYLHCWGGRGRAGTVGACVLGKMYGLSGEEALTRVQRAFDTRNDGGRKSPETPEQQNLVKAYLA